jgi:DNA mismatch repair protein MutH
MSACAAAPLNEAELLASALALCGCTLGEIAAVLGVVLDGGGARSKGKAGQLLERALGASGGAGAVRDFPGLAVELKSIPVDLEGRPRESTFVCALPLAEADRAVWGASWVRRKLGCVLWLPVITPARSAPAERRIGRAVLWRPTRGQEAVLAADFEEIVGRVGAGRVEELDGRAGRWLQARPKAAHGRVRTVAYGVDEEPIAVLPRGFYLRARFTGALLRDAAAMPD